MVKPSLAHFLWAAQLNIAPSAAYPEALQQRHAEEQPAQQIRFSFIPNSAGRRDAV
jgi:hypothetical protein